MDESTSIYQPPSTALTSVLHHQPLDKNLIPTPMLPNTPLPDLETDKDKNGKNAAMDFCHSSENNFSDGNLSRAGNASDETFSNDENKEELMPASEKAKWILCEDPIEAMELHFENLGMKDLASFYGMKNMAGLDQHRAFKERYPQEGKIKFNK